MTDKGLNLAFPRLVHEVQAGSLCQRLKGRECQSVNFLVCLFEKVGLKSDFDLLQTPWPPTQTDLLLQLSHVLDVWA